MKYYSELALLGVFNYDDAKKIINNTNPMKVLSSYIKKGYIKKIKHNLYTCVDLVTYTDLTDKYLIATKINDDSFIIGHTAFEFYGFYNQVFYNCQVAALKKFQEFEYDNINYEYFSSNNLTQVVTLKGVKVTTIERTIIDSIDLIDKVMDLEELLKCIDVIPKIKEANLKEMLLSYDKDILYRKVGYILSYFKDELNLSDDFFSFCINHSSSTNRGRLTKYNIDKQIYIPKWHLYGFKNLNKIIKKDAGIDV